MKYEQLKKAVITLALTVMFLMGLGIGDNARAQGHHERFDHERFERERLERIRHLDHERQLRYQNLHGRRIVGYHDRFGRFHRYGWYDRSGRLHTY